MERHLISKDEILQNCRILVSQKGIESIDIRSVATECSISVGSVYRFFPSKEALLLETVASVWEDILPEPNLETMAHFSQIVEWLFDAIQAGNKKYPGFLSVHGQSFTKEAMNTGAARHHQCIIQLQNMLKASLDQDSRVKRNLFTRELNEDDFLRTIYLSVLALIQDGANDCNALIKMIQLLIY